MTTHDSSSSHRPGEPFAQAVADALAQLASVPGSDVWPLSERLSAFHFMLLDAVEVVALDIEPDAPARAFRREASGFFSPFHEALRDALPAVGRASDVSGVNRWVADLPPNRLVVTEIMVQLVQAALEDDSEEGQRSAALADRVLTLLASVGATPIPQKLVDVIRYAIEAGYLPVDKLPWVGEWFARKEENNEHA